MEHSSLYLYDGLIIGQNSNISTCCTVCGIQTEIFEHILCQCDIVQAFWKAILQISIVPLKINNINLTDIIIGVNPEKSDILPNQIIILATRIIIRSKHQQLESSLYNFKHKVKEIYSMEQRMYSTHDVLGEKNGQIIVTLNLSSTFVLDI